ncbi:hypothetical protein GCM10025865_25430 [Paraoerskovia sediminicola]|uniref:Uncharacterized protein n=1 Tax=Paraoerskovia sediminicola TaxID=1138587 RepID=A0ABM8G516_9CELL|nr:hypothetical protein GCM10025865_25430 [Paraoerskovia sediminicola]
MRAVAEPPDELARGVLERGERTPAAVEAGQQVAGADEAQEGRVELVGRVPTPVPGVHGVDDERPLAGVVHAVELDPAADHGVLDVVHRVRDVVGEVHDLRLHALDPVGRALAQPREDGPVVVVHAELRCRQAVLAHRTLAAAPRVLDARVERGPGQVQAGGPAVGREHLGLEPRQEPQRLRVALEPADVAGDVRERPLAVVAERRVAEVVRQAGGVDDVGVAAEGLAELSTDLRDLEAVRQARADEVVAAGAEDLGLGAEPAQGGRVDDAGAVALEGRADLALGRFRRPPLDVGGAVAGLRLVPGWGHARSGTVWHVTHPSQTALLRPRRPPR